MADLREAEWSVTSSVDNGAATASKAAQADRRHVLMSIEVSYSDNTLTKLLTVKDGTTTLWTRYVTGNITITGVDIMGSINSLVSADIAASGTGGKVGVVTITGRTI